MLLAELDSKAFIWDYWFLGNHVDYQLEACSLYYKPKRICEVEKYLIHGSKYLRENNELSCL